MKNRVDKLEFIVFVVILLKMLFKNNTSKIMDIEPESSHNEVFVGKVHLSVHTACVMIGLCNLMRLFNSLV